MANLGAASDQNVSKYRITSEENVRFPKMGSSKGADPGFYLKEGVFKLSTAELWHLWG